MFSKDFSKEVRVTLLELEYLLKKAVIEDKYRISIEQAKALLYNNLVIDVVVQELGGDLTYINESDISLSDISRTRLLIEEVNDILNVSDFSYENKINGFGYIVAAIEFALNIGTYNQAISDKMQAQSSSTPLEIGASLSSDKLWDDFSHEVIK
ncbi:hypothetical protein M3916_001475 [Vibrio parahaemolyticus]|nr:hypothetical protein [Vibrio parahaemolyticus]